MQKGGIAMKYVVALLALFFSVGVYSETPYNFDGGPFIVDAVKSNEGVLEIVVPRKETSISIVLKGCDRVDYVEGYGTNTHRYAVTHSISNSRKSVTLRSEAYLNLGGKYKEGRYPVNIHTTEGLVHTVAVVVPPKNYNASNTPLKAIIEHSSECYND